MKRKVLKIITILGTRPEIIRLSRVMALLDDTVEHITVHTGQNYDYELNEIFYRDLGIRKPDIFMGVKSPLVGEVIGKIIIEAEKIFRREKPDAVVILGDTNSALSSIIAKRLKIPIFHMEAGNRCFDFNVPEEINRRIVDHISDFNLVYTEHARRNLLQEGIHPRKIYLTGSPMKEVLDYYLPKIKRSSILKKLQLKKNGYFVLSTHREENVDAPENLAKIMTAINGVVDAYGLPVIVSTHPRTKKRLESLRGVTLHKKISFLKPFGFFDYVNLQMNARCVISDSGTISEESSILQFPAVTIRNAMERPEAMDSGAIILTGLEPDAVLAAVAVVLRERKAGHTVSVPADYLIANTSQRVVKLIVGTSGLIHRWDGINSVIS
ncbi:MAG: UDP-N-acetylglucosamine 2-epimerase (non-hydrolyzing) [Elusimicrobia bacterium]|nr:UDP-N-acetylglucosamine 2-epimerase (non-hydrolyzing) [Elusimicrobiota bacterium]